MTARHAPTMAVSAALLLASLAAPGAARAATGDQGAAAAQAVAAAPAHGYFLSNRSSGAADVYAALGSASDTPLVGDWDGDGVQTLGVRRGNTYYLTNAVAGGRVDVTASFGTATDVPLVGDWNGDGRDSIGLRRGKDVYLSNDVRRPRVEHGLSYGLATDEFFVGDWNGDGAASFGIRRGNDYFLTDAWGGPATIGFRYATNTDVPLVGDWDGDGRQSIGVRRGREYHLRDLLSAGPAQYITAYGTAMDQAVVGDWDGDGRQSVGVRRYPTVPYSSSITAVTAAELGESWRPGCPVAPSGLRNVHVRYWGYDRYPRTGTLQVAASEAPAVAAVFGDLYAAGFPIHKMYTSALYGGSDDALTQDDNTSAFLCRTVPGSSTISQHSYGLAIDINPLVNPWVYSGGVIPAAGAPYANRNQSAPGMIQPDDAVVRAFAARGWRWGGYWTSSKDYQHFSRNGR